MADQATKDNIVKPVQLAKELDVRPQQVFGWIRQDKIPSHECVCGHKYLLRDEIKDFLDARAAAEAEKAAKVEAELEEEEEDPFEAAV